MEYKFTTSSQQDEEEDTLSLRDLPIYDDNHDSYQDHNHNTDVDEPFQFFPFEFAPIYTSPVAFSKTTLNPKTLAALNPKTLTTLNPVHKKTARNHGSRLKRWCSLVFGFHQKYSAPKRVEVGEMRERLSRRNPLTLEELLEESSGSSISNGKLINGGLGQLIRSWSCRGDAHISVSSKMPRQYS